ncbi:hypothetical protein O181_129825 [Austropuccinia psidii MF-1]|uniref:Uncharacterized protein n=1 Tax=Austropuccinia psidii MF-1 TaxID=1389203 RepID=A0A9Q3L2M8_9BASI|nr:hypothetical protein [Austropuccinia psidii MF-1]
MSPVHLRNLVIPRDHPEDRQGLFRMPIPGTKHLGHNSGCKPLREIILTLTFTFQLKRNLKPEDWNNMDQALQLHQLLKDLLEWNMESKRFNLESHCSDLGASFQKICLKEIPFKDMVITKGWNPNRQFKLLEERETVSL